MIYNRNRILLVALLLLTSVSVDLAKAQAVRKERRRDFIENLLRAVIESQVDSQDARNPGQIIIRPGQNPQNIVRPGQPGVIIQPGRPQVVGSPQMIQVRQYVTSLSNECDHLIQDLRAQSGTVPQVLPLLGDAIQLRANINVFQQQCAAYPNIEPVRQRMINLDRNWRVLNHRLRQIKQLSPECARCLDRCQLQHQKLCDTFQLQPQFQRRELARLVNEMHADIKHLIQDIYYECRNNPRLPNLMNQGQTLQAQIEQYAPLVNRGNYDQVVTAFKNCRTLWRTFSHEALHLASERIRHDVCHIEDLGRQAAELLQLPYEFDREYTSDVCGWVDEEVGHILNEITLADLLECSKPAEVIAAARGFRTKCSAFYKGINRENRPYEKLCLDYRGLDTAWNTLNSQCRTLSNPDIIRRLDEIAYTMSILQPAFGAGPILSRDALIRMSAELGQMANQIHMDVHRFDEGRYEQRVYRNLCKQCDDLHDSARKLHNMIVTKPRANYRPQMKKCFKQWTDVRDLIKQCPPSDRRRLAAYRGQIEPLMAKLQLVYAD